MLLAETLIEKVDSIKVFNYFWKILWCLKIVVESIVVECLECDLVKKKNEIQSFIFHQYTLSVASIASIGHRSVMHSGWKFLLIYWNILFSI